MPGEPTGMAGTTKPRARDFFLEQALDFPGWNVALDHIAANLCGMAGAVAVAE